MPTEASVLSLSLFLSPAVLNDVNTKVVTWNYGSIAALLKTGKDALFTDLISSVQEHVRQVKIFNVRRS